MNYLNQLKQKDQSTPVEKLRNERNRFYQDSLESSKGVSPIVSSRRVQESVSPIRQEESPQLIVELTLESLIAIMALERELEKSKIEISMCEDFNMI